jgi:TldD protein
VSFYDINKKIMIANSDGLYVEDSQTLSRFGVSCAGLEGTSVRSMGYESKSGPMASSTLTTAWPRSSAARPPRWPSGSFPAEDAPAGEFPIVIAAGFGGIFFHEAIGHSLEADGIRKKTSCFWDKLGQPIASPAVTLADDGTWKGGWGAVNVDDEGCVGKNTILIDKGICAASSRTAERGADEDETDGQRPPPVLPVLSHPAHDEHLHARRVKTPPEDIVKSVDKGLFIAKIGGGNVQPTTGRFVFSVTEGYMIEGGKVTQPLKGIMLMGNGPDVLMNISMVASDLLVIGGGSCGKDGQSKPVGFGNPTLKVDKITVGGKKA